MLNRHIFYLDCAAHALAEPTYVNLVRDPIDRCISRFYYERDARGTVGATMTIDECMDRGKCKFDAWRMRESVADGGGHTRFNQLREECSSNYLARWFCGMDERCKSATGQELLERARVSVARKYAVVGSKQIVHCTDGSDDAARACPPTSTCDDSPSWWMTEPSVSSPMATPAFLATPSGSFM